MRRHKTIEIIKILKQRILNDNARAVLIAIIFEIAITFYLFRSAYHPLGLVANLSFSFLCIIILLDIFFFKKKVALKNTLFHIKEFLIVGLFFVYGLLISDNIIKHTLNDLIKFIIVAVFLLSYFLYFKKISVKRLMNYWLYISAGIGVIASIKWLNEVKDLDVSLLNLSFGSISLVSDYNFYSLFFILSIVLLWYNGLKKNVNQNIVISNLLFWIYVINVLLSNSRRGLILFVILMIFGACLLVFNRSNKTLLRLVISNQLIIYFLIVALVIIIPIRSSIIQDKRLRERITATIFRYSTLINNDVKRESIRKILWPRNDDYLLGKESWSKYSASIDLSMEGDSILHPAIKNFYNNEMFINYKNVLYNSNFEVNNLFWSYTSPDTVMQTVIFTEIGKVMQVKRGEGVGYWQLLYSGRHVYFKKNANYIFRFLYQVVSGSNDPIPFSIGWNVNDGGVYRYNTPINRTNLGNGWYGATAAYKFQENHALPVISFMNSQKANTIINFANIELLCHDSISNSIYLDQNLLDVQVKEQNEIIDIESVIDPNKEKFSRLSHFKFAIDLFKSMNLKQKIFGNGFNYMPLFSKEFIHKELSIKEIKEAGYYDYPHNPVLSSLLYSGILGCLIYVYFLLLVFYYYLKYFKYLSVLFIMFFVTFFFAMISGNSHFSVPVFTLLSVIPFVIKSLINIGELKK